MENKNVIIFGEAGTGKSYITNMLMGEKVVTLSDSAIRCSLNFKCYSNQVYNYYDIEGDMFELKNAKEAIISLLNILKSTKTGINLLILTVVVGRINNKTELYYKLFAEALCRNQVPVLLVITKCEHYSNMNEWWIKNKTHFDKYNMQLVDTISIGAANVECYDDEDEDFKDLIVPLLQRKFNESKGKLKESIARFALQKGWKIEPLPDWVITTIKKALNIFMKTEDLTQVTYWPELKEWIKNNFGCTEKEAIKYANDVCVNYGKF